MSIRQSINSRKIVLQALNFSYEKILKNYEFINSEARDRFEIVSAAEWLLDNIYLIEKEYKTIKKNMPYSYFENLPLIDEGITNSIKDENEGSWPRIYSLAHNYIEKNQGKVDIEKLIEFINQYEGNLTLGELWALPLMLRINIIEKLSIICEKLGYIQGEKKKADKIADVLIEAYHNKKGAVEETITNLNREHEKLSPEIVEKLIRVLRDNSVNDENIYEWITSKVESEGIKNAVYLEHRHEGKLQVAIGRYITSLRTISSCEWKSVFVKISKVEKLLNEDPSGIYKKMDFATKDYYRHNIEVIAKKINVSELELTKKIISLSKSSKGIKGEEYKTHVGYYIIDSGVNQIKKEFGSASSREKSFTNVINVNLYISLILLATLFIEAIIGFWIYGINGPIVWWKWVIFALILFVPISEAVTSLVNWSCGKLVKPSFIPKLDLSKGIGKENKTIVVIPAMVQNEAKVVSLMEKLETYYISNKDSNIYFAILADFKDSDVEKNLLDEVINRRGIREAEILNEKYGYARNPHFYFFNRVRKFNKSENTWMGWERKRGKLMEFMALLKGKETSYNVKSYSIDNLKDARYIITLDEDTKLTLDTGKKLIGAMGHILNKGYTDSSGKVVRGYGIMQPKISVDVEAKNKTLFSKVFSGETGIDIYTTAVSDTYQDLFGEGIFTGKGIIDIDLFYNRLKDKVPENTILSHDLLEGSYARCALVTDIELIDGYPAFYKASAERLHRWVRGDWQLLPWMFDKNLNTLSKWKIFDNLRRSLLSPSIVICLYVFAILYSNVQNLSFIALVAIAIPILFNITDLVVTPKNIFIGSFKTLRQIFYIISFIPNQCKDMLDAIFTTLYRLTISKKNMLKWKTAEEVEKNHKPGLSSYIRFMWVGSLIGLGLLILSFSKSLELGIVNIPVSLLWIVSPFIANEISKPIKKEALVIEAEDRKFIRNISRRTWAYYEDFVNKENNYLAPDNYQSNPNNGLAYRTSPTNIGMGLMSNIVAYDLGYIHISEVAKRLKEELDSIDSLQKYHGHLLNWYDTKTKNPLHPRYVSTVDSGNLVSYYWVIREALRDSLKSNVISKKNYLALLDTLDLVKEELNQEFFEDERVKINEITDDILSIDILNSMLEKIKKIEEEYEIENIYWTNKLKKECESKLSQANVYKEKGLKVCDVKSLSDEINSLINRLDAMVKETDFSVLYNEDMELFSIGYDMENDTLGNSFYDLLASEARTASFVAIAKGDIKKDHWFKLGRAMTNTFSLNSLVSWSGTMFEYFMPPLIMKSYKDTLLDTTYKSVIKAQKNYAQKRKIPWGISESAFYHFDISMNYQYKAFGIPGIGLKRGLVDELVVAPYASIMALSFTPHDVIRNLREFKDMGMLGKYGFYEAIDFTEERIPKGKNKALVECFMVHHEGMSFMALDNFLNDNILQKRFHSIVEVKAYEVLLQERTKREITFSRETEIDLPQKKPQTDIMFERNYPFVTENPNVLALSNGIYSTIVTNSGCGYSKKDDMMIYRWREDAVQEGYGNFIYIKNLNSNEYWSNTFEPTRVNPDEESVKFILNKGEFYRRDGNIETTTEVGVSDEDNLEVRKLTIRNNSSSSRCLELTSYMEVTLATYSSDVVHPTFSNLFIITEYDEHNKVILANRRPRAKGQKKPFVFQTVFAEGELVGALSYETSRVNFIGRNRDLINPKAMDNDAALENTQGIVLDPIIALRARVSIPAESKVTISFITGIAENREEAISIANKAKHETYIDSVFKGSKERTLIELKYMGIKTFQANLYQSIASSILFLSPLRKERSSYIQEINRHQCHLWSYGISGDLPIVLLLIDSVENVDLVRNLISLHVYLRNKGIKYDLVIYNDEETSYHNPVQGGITEVINGSLDRDNWNKPGGVFLHSKTTMPPDIKDFLIAISRLVFYADKGTLLEQSGIKLNKDSDEDFDISYRHKELKDKKKVHSKAFNETSRNSNVVSHIEEPSLNNEVNDLQNSTSEFDSMKEGLDYFNGYGGFTEDNTYKIILRNGEETPAPWINVISNNNFGFHISESGASYTWQGNSRENKITSWSNDWIRDSLGEALYIRDDKNKRSFSITPKPLRDNGEYIIEHGFGYSNFTHKVEGIEGELTCFCPIDESVKYYIVSLENLLDEERELTALYYAELVLGVVKEHSESYISTHIDNENNFIWGHNPYSEFFGKGKAYLKIVGGEEETFTGNRLEFLGRENTVNYPLALSKDKLSNTSGGGIPSCLSTAVKIKLKKGETKKIVVVLGQNENLDKIKQIIQNSNDIKHVENEFEKTKKYWKDFLGSIHVKTPDKSMNHMLNGWLMYQTLSCRFWSRTAFYQSGGAYGFRDQLQDSLSLGLLDSEFTRSQILRNAARQYEEGDVQHWWHPVVNSGIRTRFSDDLLWLPYAVGEYIKRTGDYDVLEEKMPYLKDSPLEDGEDERYTIVDETREDGTIYDHCIRALKKGLNFGIHDIPLMGSGDWNDGMSTVGNEGKGESVWLGWFLYDILEKFKPICDYKNDKENLEKYEKLQVFLQENLEKNAWDGGWYRRAYFDDGTPLGSVQNDECSIDSLSQSWAVISGAGKESRIKEAMEAVEKNLVKEDLGLILLLAPPFNNSKLEPGYIKGYVPGVRENGGQYTHAAVWVILAFTKLGLGDKALKYYNMINPINHTSSTLEAKKYKVEPYVIAADVYIKEPHGGRGGWSWYTGASGWFYKVGIEDILGLRTHYGKGFNINPCIPKSWEGFEIDYKYKGTQYNIKVENSYKGTNKEIYLDGVPFEGEYIPYGTNEKYDILVKI